MGCGRHQQTRDEPISVSATIVTDCIVHYYKSNSSAYITQQQHGYNPSARFLEVIANEPGGKVKYTLKEDSYSSSDLKKQFLSDLPRSFWSKNLAIGVFYSFCAGGGLLETDSMVSGEKVKIEGSWYQPLKPEWPTEVKLTLFQLLDTKRIELVQIEDEQAGLVWLFRSYNMRYNKELSKTLPRAIDVLDIRNGIPSKELMIRFDYKDIQKVQQKEASK